VESADPFGFGSFSAGQVFLYSPAPVISAPTVRRGCERVTEIVVNRLLDRCEVLGPGVRAVVWVQGCPLRCRECIAAETLSFDGGRVMPVAELASWLCSLVGVEGVTLSGGEPFAQARPLAQLLDEVRAVRPDFTAMSYSGFTLAAVRRGTPAQRALLDRLDLLVDGPYQVARHGDLRWRGSSNQRLIPLSDRYRDLLAEPDIGAGIEFTVGLDRTLSWAGVPGVPGFRDQVTAALAAQSYGLRVQMEEA
jgi:anaerobic ribonucleoside-triphosphate reductase activating protein